MKRCPQPRDHHKTFPHPGQPLVTFRNIRVSDQSTSGLKVGTMITSNHTGDGMCSMSIVRLSSPVSIGSDTFGATHNQIRLLWFCCRKYSVLHSTLCICNEQIEFGCSCEIHDHINSSRTYSTGTSMRLARNSAIIMRFSSSIAWLRCMISSRIGLLRMRWDRRSLSSI